MGAKLDVARFQKAHTLFSSTDSAQVGRRLVAWLGSHALLGQWDDDRAAQVNGGLAAAAAAADGRQPAWER